MKLKYQVGAVDNVRRYWICFKTCWCHVGSCNLKHQTLWDQSNSSSTCPRMTVWWNDSAVLTLSSKSCHHFISKAWRGNKTTNCPLEWISTHVAWPLLNTTDDAILLSQRNSPLVLRVNHSLSTFLFQGKTENKLGINYTLESWPRESADERWDLIISPSLQMKTKGTEGQMEEAL